MPKKLVRIFAILISYVPSWLLRRMFYKYVFRYEIGANCFVGFGTELAVDRVEMKNGASIGRGNKIIGAFDLLMAENARIGFRNQIICADWASDFRPHDYKSEFNIGRDARIANEHKFDLMCSISIGDRTRVAGSQSQFWTHGPSGDKPIRIASDCYLGTSVRLLSGASLGEYNLVGAGSVLSADLSSSTRSFVGGVPAKHIRDISRDLETKAIRWGEYSAVTFLVAALTPLWDDFILLAAVPI